MHTNIIKFPTIAKAAKTAAKAAINNNVVSFNDCRSALKARSPRALFVTTDVLCFSHHTA